MNPVRLVLRAGFNRLERAFDRIFGPAWNPLNQLGALGFFYYWIVAVSGIYLYIGFDTGVAKAYQSVEYLTHAQWYLGGVMRSFHRYASDAMVAMMAIHLLREFSLDRYRGIRWFSWFTGVPIMWLVYASGITGYWLVWDKLAQYVAVATSEWLDALPIFAEPIVRNFLAPGSVDDRLFTLLVFLHIAVPLILLFIMWVHLHRISRPKVNPPRGLAIGTMAMMLALSLAYPAASQGPADLSIVPAVVKLDWFYLAIYPLFDIWSYGAVWGLVGVATVILAAMPWLPPFRKPAPAVVDLAMCNGCGRCAQDCPYGAVTMERRSDGLPFEHEAVVKAGLCVSCGICVGACPTSSAFRRTAGLANAIDLPHPSLRALKEMTEAAAQHCTGDMRVLIFGCDHGVRVRGLEAAGVAAVSLPCVAMLPPSFIDYVLSRDLADGVMLAGCRESACYNRFGIRWTEDRLARRRDPRLRERVARERIARAWCDEAGTRELVAELVRLRARLAALGKMPRLVRIPALAPGHAVAAPEARR